MIIFGPYASKYARIYLITGGDGRKSVVLYNSAEDRLTISYARYLYTVGSNAFIPAGFEVDHINGQKTDDRYENLQLLSQEDNLKKQYVERGLSRQYVRFSCICGKEFDKPRNKTHLVVRGKVTDCCSRSCAAKASHRGLESEIVLEYAVPKHTGLVTQLVE